MSKISAALAAIVGLAGAAAAQAPGEDLLFNGSFEQDIQFDFGAPGFNPLNFTAFFGGGGLSVAQETDAALAFDGERFLRFSSDGGNANTFVGVSATTGGFAVGDLVDFTIAARLDSDTVLDVLEFRLEFRNSDGDIIGDQFAFQGVLNASNLTSEYQTFAVSDFVGDVFVPEGTVGAAAVIAYQSFDGGGQGGQVLVDDARVFIVPTPASAALLGLGGLAAARRRR